MWLIRTDILTAFQNEEIKLSIPRYISVVKDQKPALFLIASRFPVDRPSDKEDLWSLHDELMNDFWKFVDNFDSIDLPPKPLYSLLDLKTDIAKRILTSCELCERRCLVNRKNGELGVCRVSEKPRVSTFFIHMGEEAPISPSGTIFFSSCNFRCVFCQNWDISQNPKSGRLVNSLELANMFVTLRKEGARNINLVGGEPTPNIPAILDALRLTDINVPIIWNSNMYLTPESMKLLIGLVDLWLPDFKYWDEEHALKLSGIANYTRVVRRNLKMAYNARGEMVIRHLVLPNHIECCSKPILRWISDNLPRALVNIMAQYRPEYKALRYPEISRRPSAAEMKEAYREAEKLGLRWRSVS